MTIFCLLACSSGITKKKKTVILLVARLLAGTRITYNGQLHLRPKLLPIDPVVFCDKLKMAGKSLIDRLKKAVKKIKVLLDFNTNRWKIASLIGTASSGKRRLSFNVKPGLKEYAQDSFSRSRSELHRTQSFPMEDDIDKRAEAFIENFRNQLKYERQISLQLRYYRGNSFDSVQSP